MQSEINLLLHLIHQDTMYFTIGSVLSLEFCNSLEQIKNEIAKNKSQLFTCDEQLLLGEQTH